MAAHGMKSHAVVQPREDIWEFFSGLVKTAARGMNAHAVMQPLEVTWKFSDGDAKTAARGMKTRALRQTMGGHHEVLQWASENGCPRYDTGNPEDALRYPENLVGGNSFLWGCWDY